METMKEPPVKRKFEKFVLLKGSFASGHLKAFYGPFLSLRRALPESGAFSAPEGAKSTHTVSRRTRVRGLGGVISAVAVHTYNCHLLHHNALTMVRTRICYTLTKF